jgi:hypothetical protein
LTPKGREEKISARRNSFENVRTTRIDLLGNKNQSSKKRMNNLKIPPKQGSKMKKRENLERRKILSLRKSTLWRTTL